MARLYGFVCSSCGQRYPLDTRDWLCACGGFFDLHPWPAFDPDRIDGAQPGLWRYRTLLPIEEGWEAVTLGEGATPLVQVEWDGAPLHFKLESLCPTGSFKDRGAAVLVTAMAGLGFRRLVEDSSGNAGASLAAYAARAGITCDVCVPDTAGGPKLMQMAAYGAEVIQIKGKREYAALAAWAAAAHGAHYASHVYNPFFLAGTETAAYEIWEQLGHRPPGSVIVPVGNGTLLLGLYRGFERLRGAGLIARAPRLIAVQAAECAPIRRAFDAQSDALEPVLPGPTVATGIAVAQPSRGMEVVQAVRATGGQVVDVTEQEILDARTRLAHIGFYVEPTAAAGPAAWLRMSERLGTNAPVVMPLTGHGLKSP